MVEAFFLHWPCQYFWRTFVEKKTATSHPALAPYFSFMLMLNLDLQNLKGDLGLCGGSLLFGFLFLKTIPNNNLVFWQKLGHSNLASATYTRVPIGPENHPHFCSCWRRRLLQGPSIHFRCCLARALVFSNLKGVPENRFWQFGAGERD